MDMLHLQFSTRFKFDDELITLYKLRANVDLTDTIILEWRDYDNRGDDDLDISTIILVFCMIYCVGVTRVTIHGHRLTITEL